MFGGLFEVEQASLPDSVVFGGLSFEQDGLCLAEVDIGGCQGVQTFVAALMIVVVDEGVGPRFELTFGVSAY